MVGYLRWRRGRRLRCKTQDRATRGHLQEHSCIRHRDSGTWGVLVSASERFRYFGFATVRFHNNGAANVLPTAGCHYNNPANFRPTTGCHYNDPTNSQSNGQVSLQWSLAFSLNAQVSSQQHDVWSPRISSHCVYVGWTHMPPLRAASPWQIYSNTRSFRLSDTYLTRS